MLCYAMLCYAMLCYAMLCYAMLCYAMLCYAMLCYASVLRREPEQDRRLERARHARHGLAVAHRRVEPRGAVRRQAARVVGVAVRAVGPNFRHLLNVLRSYPGDAPAPGADCAVSGSPSR